MSAPFRIRRGSAAVEGKVKGFAPGEEPASAQAPAEDVWLARIVKLVPSEIIAVYLAGTQIAKSWLGTWASICLLLVLVVRVLGTKEAGKPVQVIAVAVSAVSFVIWVYASGGHFLAWTLPPDTGYASAAVFVWTILVPYFYKGD